MQISVLICICFFLHSFRLTLSHNAQFFQKNSSYFVQRVEIRTVPTPIKIVHYFTNLDASQHYWKWGVCMPPTIISGAITAEQFLFYEMRITARLYQSEMTLEQAIVEITAQNLFQYPTERETARMVRACYKRLDALGDDMLRQALLDAPTEDAKQINLYAMMCQNLLVWKFMVEVIGEKYRTQDDSFSTADVGGFLSRLQSQNDQAAGWSPTTITKIRQVLTRCLVEAGYLDSVRSIQLNPMQAPWVLGQGILRNHDAEALIAFGCTT